MIPETEKNAGVSRFLTNSMTVLFDGGTNRPYRGTTEFLDNSKIHKYGLTLYWINAATTRKLCFQ